MLENNDGTLRAVAWSEIFPWLNLFRSFRLAIDLRVMLLAAVGILLTVTGWWFFGLVLSGDPDDPEAVQWMEAYRGCPWQTITAAVPEQPAWPGSADNSAGQPFAPSVSPSQLRDPFFGSWAQLSRPLWGAFLAERTTVDGIACSLLCGLWALAIWAFFGAAITRIAAVQLTCDERVGLAPALRFACSKWRAYFAAPLFPLLGVLLVVAVLLVFLFAWVLNWNVGILVLGLLWFVYLPFGLVMAVLLLGLIFGWPLMWATISTEGTDSFDALNRTYAYVFGRPLHYLFYASVAAVLGALGWLLVSNFAAGVISMTYWAASWGCTDEQIKLIVDRGDELGWAGGFGATMIHFWIGCVKFLAVGFFYGYFWVATAAIYLLLRRDVDATEMDEVFLDEDASEQTFGLPPLATDEAGAPVATDELPETAPEDNGPNAEEGPDVEEGPNAGEDRHEPPAVE